MQKKKLAVNILGAGIGIPLGIGGIDQQGDTVHAMVRTDEATEIARILSQAPKDTEGEHHDPRDAWAGAFAAEPAAVKSDNPHTN